MIITHNLIKHFWKKSGMRCCSCIRLYTLCTCLHIAEHACGRINNKLTAVGLGEPGIHRDCALRGVPAPLSGSARATTDIVGVNGSSNIPENTL